MIESGLRSRSAQFQIYYSSYSARSLYYQKFPLVYSLSLFSPINSYVFLAKYSVATMHIFLFKNDHLRYAWPPSNASAFCLQILALTAHGIPFPHCALLPHSIQCSISQRKLSFYNLSLQHFPLLLPKLSLGFILSYTFLSQIRHHWSPPTFSGSQSEEQGSANFLLPTITSRLLFVHYLSRNFDLNSSLSLQITYFPSCIQLTPACFLSH